MPIEFRCSQCDRLLRVSDDTAGRQAKCPACGMQMTIPTPPPEAPPRPAAPPGPLSSGPTAAGTPAADTYPPGAFPSTGGSAAGQAFNPYQAPSFAAAAPPAAESHRTGPAWERVGPSPRSFFATLSEAYANPARFFATMRRRDGMGNPLLFALTSGTLSFAILMAFQLALQTMVEAMGMPVFGGGGDVNPVATFCCCTAMWPLFLVFYLFLAAGIYHLMLMLLGALDLSFETTLRAVAYSSGVTFVLMVIPVCGQYIFGIAQIVFAIIGLAYAHETSGGKAAGAVLVPAGICCGGMIALAIAFGAMLMDIIERGA